MSGRYLTELADVCRDAVLVVHEVDGWQTRARTSGGYADGRPWCVMWHHTASSTTPANDVSFIVSGSDDAPLANLYLDRDGAVWVCAAGCTNTNGKGGPFAVSRGTVPADSMNSYAIGIEAANDGVGEAWPQAQIDAYFTLSNALTRGYQLDTLDVCTHNRWAPDRKIDPATAAAVQGPWRPDPVTSSGTWDLLDIEAECLVRSTTPTLEDDDVRVSPYLIQATGKDGHLPGTVYATDGQMMTLRALEDEQALAGYRWNVRNNGGDVTRYPELADGAPIQPVDDLAAFGVVIG